MSLKPKERLNALQSTVQAIEKQFGRGAVMLLGQRSAEKIETIPTGAGSLDRALGCGGYPRGRIVEIYGPEASGKTTLTLHAIANCQRAGGTAAFVDAEHALDVGYARALGVQAEKLLVSQPDTGEQALQIAEMLVRSCACDLVVIDSVAALVPEAELRGEMGDTHVGLQARLMSRALRKLTGVGHTSGTTIIFINQLRTKIGQVMGSPETTTGGHALKYYASVRLDIRRIGQVKVADRVIGNRTRVKVVKNKLAPPFQSTEFDIRYGVGIDSAIDLLEAAVGQGVVSKHGAYYAFESQNIGQGREQARQAMLDDPQLRERLEARFSEALASKAQAPRSTKKAA